MTGLIVMALLSFIGTWMVQGLHVSTITAMIGTGMFCVRKIGVKCQAVTIVKTEVFGLFITTLFQVLLKRFSFLEFLLVVLLRLVVIGISYYDDRFYVYVTEEKRKDDLG